MPACLPACRVPACLPAHTTPCLPACLQHLSRQMGDAFGGSLSSAVGRYLQLFEAAGQLSQQPEAALLAAVELSSTAGAVVSPLQKARMLALCRPLHPDVAAIVRAGLIHFSLLEPADAAEAAALGAGLAAGEEAPAPSAGTEC